MEVNKLCAETLESKLIQDLSGVTQFRRGGARLIFGQQFYYKISMTMKKIEAQMG